MAMLKMTCIAGLLIGVAGVAPAGAGEGQPSIEEMTVWGAANPPDATLKIPASAHETPRSVTVIDAERIREQNFRTPIDTFYYTPGVFPNSTASGGYHFIARGFRMSPDETLIDGFSGFYVGGGQSPQMLYGVDRIMVLRGPAGLLYGASALPGGLINIVTKKPEEMASRRLDVTSGTYAGNGVGFGGRASLGAEIDLTGPLTDDGRVLYRAIVAGDDSPQYTGDVHNRTRFASGALTFQLDAEGRYAVTPLVQFTHNRRPAGAAMVASPTTSLATNDGLSGPIATSDLSPLDVNLHEGGRTDDMLVAGFDARFGLLDAVTLNAAYRYIDYATDILQWTPQVTTAAHRAALLNNRTVARVQAKSTADRHSHNFDVNTLVEFAPGELWKNRLQAGINGRQYNSASRSATGPLATAQSPIAIDTGIAATPVTDVSTGWGATSIDHDFYWNAYLQNQAALFDERWVLTVGLGYGQQHYNDARTRKGDVTPNAALLFNATRQLAFYASYATSYQPADPAIEDYAGDTGGFDPQTGVSYEIGAKYDLPTGTGLAIALFDTRRDKVIVQDTSQGTVNVNGRPYYVQQSGQRARGVELSGEHRLRENWRVNGTFAYIDASYRQGALPEPVAKTPEFSASLFTRYDLARGPLRNLGLNLGVVWQDERMGGNAARTATAPDPLMLPAFFRVDAGLNYRFDNGIDLALNMQNLLDKKIFVDGTTGANLQIAAPRTLALRAGWRF